MGNLAATVPQVEPDRRLWIRAQLLLRNITLGQLSRAEGLSQSAVKTALWKPYGRGEAAIARALDMRPQDIWPERYDADGLPIHRRKAKAQPDSGSAAGGIAAPAATPSSSPTETRTTTADEQGSSPAEKGAKR